MVRLFIAGNYLNLAVNSANELPKFEALRQENSFGKPTSKRGEREELRKLLDQHQARDKAL